MKFFILLLVSSLLVFGEVIVKGDFVWDDEALVVNNPLIKEVSFLKYAFTKHLYWPKAKEGNFWRPLQTFVYFLEYQLFKLNSRIYHLVNIVFHAVVSFLVYLVIYNIFKDKFLSKFVSFLFLIHPLNSESVCYISGLADLGMGVFILLSFYLLLKRNFLFYFLSILSFSISLLFKEASLVYPLWIGAYLFLFETKDDFKSKFYKLIGFIGVVFIYTWVRLKILGISFLGRGLVGNYPLLMRLEVLPQIFRQYLFILLFPFNLHMSRNVVLFDKLNIYLVVQIIVFILILCVLIYYSFKNWILKFSLLWFFIFLFAQLPVFSINAFLAEHFLYLPQIGFWIFLGYFIKKIKFRRWIIIFLFIYFSILTIFASSNWVNNERLYAQVIKYEPLSFSAYNNLGVIYLYKYRDYRKAEELIKRALAIEPNLIEGWLNLVRVYYFKGKLNKAKNLCKNLLHKFPSDYQLYNLLGTIYFKMHRFKEAESMYKKSIELNPEFAPLWYDLYLFYKERNDRQKALFYLKEAMKRDPSYKAELYFTEAQQYLDDMKLDKALERINKAINLESKASAYYNLKGIILRRQKRFKEALEFFEEALKLDPFSAQVYNNIGILYSLVDKKDLAIQYFKKALSLKEDFFEANFNLGLLYYLKGDYKDAKFYFTQAQKIKNTPLVQEYLEHIKNKLN